MIVLILVPLTELFLVLQVAGLVGGWWTAGLLLAASLLGAYLLRVEGRRAWQQFREALAEGRWPGDEVAQGALIIVGGTLLLTPGFLTDIVGLLFLLGPPRRLVSARIRSRISQASTSGAGPGVPGPDQSRARGSASSAGTGPRVRTAGGEEVILDVEVVEIRREQRPLRDGDGDGDPDRAGDGDRDRAGDGDPDGTRDGDPGSERAG